MPLPAQVVSSRTNENRRYSSRRSLRLKSVLSDSGSEIVIHDISATGMLIETLQDFSIGETLTLDLPERGRTSAVVTWSSGPYFGCQFELSIPAATISAALLRGLPLKTTTHTGSGPDVPQLNSLAAEALEEDAMVRENWYPLRTRGLVVVGLCGLSWALIGWTFSLIWR